MLPHIDGYQVSVRSASGSLPLQLVVLAEPKAKYLTKCSACGAADPGAIYQTIWITKGLRSAHRPYCAATSLPDSAETDRQVR